ncbi:MAG TPA: rod shape-determining protein MreC [Silvibacterium sp.]|jgi:rod shape-determining protein MreC|nr:rod shape-determining protein MreC [Silvibacterium sp.]
MESFFSRYKNALVLIVVLVAQLLALAVQVKRPAPSSPDQEGVSLIRYVVVSVITPPERWLHNIGSGIRGLWFGYLDLVHVRQEDSVLKAQIEQLRLEQASLAEDARQGQRLDRLLGFKEHYVYKTLPAQVIGASGTDQSRTLYIDKGAKDGLAQDMPVVTADGIVGRLRDVFDHKSLVLLISDPTSGVGVMLETTRTRGILKGVPFGQVQVINVSPDDRIKPGETIVTSGGDQIFPRGLPVGTVERVTPDPERDPLVDVTVRPAANLSRLEEVLVITNLGDIPSAQSAKDLAESEAEGEAEKQRASDVLSERLPGRLDAKAPPDTNPDPKVADGSGTTTGEDVRLLTPPKPLRPDQYSPDATPPATEMTPGQRRGPVLQGTEDIVMPVKRTVTTTASAGSTAGATEPSTSSREDTTGVVRRAVTGSTAATSMARTTGASSTAASGINSARSASTAGGTPTGSVVSVPRPKPAAGIAASAGVNSVSGTSASSSAPKTKVIVDGPLPGGRSAEASRAAAHTAEPESATVKKKVPEIVPDDGSRPPSTERPVTAKPKPVVQPTENATPPNGGR